MTRAAGKSGEVNRKFFAADCHCSRAITRDHAVQQLFHRLCHMLALYKSFMGDHSARMASGVVLRAGRAKRTARVLMADDFAEWRARICGILNKHQQWQVIGEANDGLEAVEKSIALTPDVVLLDVGMPGINGIEAAKQIRHACPRTKIIFLTQNNDLELRNSAASIGAEGYVLKTEATEELLPVMQAALRGGFSSRFNTWFDFPAL